MKGDDSSHHRNLNSHLPKNSNLLPDPGKEKPPRTTFDNQLIELESVDSTNNYAMGRIHEGLASDGMVCLARHQWAGKGQRGKTWMSEPGQNLMMSLVIKPSPAGFIPTIPVFSCRRPCNPGSGFKNFKIKIGQLNGQMIFTGMTERQQVS